MVKIVFEFIGQFDTDNAVSPVCREEEFSGNLDETVRGISGPDDFRPVQRRRWQVRDVDLPSWMSVEEYIRDYARISTRMYYIRDVGESAGRYMLELSGPSLRAFHQLMTANLRSEFKKSLKEQVITWLEKDPVDREYPSPLSDKQWQAITRYHY